VWEQSTTGTLGLFGYSFSAIVGLTFMKRFARTVFHRTLAGIDIEAALERKLDRDGPTIRAGDAILDLRDFRTILAIALGKASDAMARGLVGILEPEFPIEGILVAPAAPPSPLPRWQVFTGGHPIPNAGSFAAGRAILERLARCDGKTLVVFLISGGGSALVEQPLDPSISLADFQALHAALVTCGAPIEEINMVRKHLSATKGGRLAAAAPQSMKLTLAISDVPLGEESALASGPTLPDPSTILDAERVAVSCGLVARLPSSLRAIFENHRLRETPKDGDPAFARSHFVRVLSEHDLFHAAHHACEAEGFICLCDDSTDGWPIEKAADYLLAQLVAQKKANPHHRVAVLADGELSSPVTGDGFGGRNAAFALACVPKIAGRDITVLSAGTDGIDGNSPAAGAVADGETLARAQKAGLGVEDFARRCDSYSFFERLGDAVVTGPTGNNLRDLRILMA
jgi:glycerate 2-kinase